MNNSKNFNQYLQNDYLRRYIHCRRKLHGYHHDGSFDGRYDASFPSSPYVELVFRFLQSVYAPPLFALSP